MSSGVDSTGQPGDYGDARSGKFGCQIGRRGTPGSGRVSGPDDPDPAGVECVESAANEEHRRRVGVDGELGGEAFVISPNHPYAMSLAFVEGSLVRG